MDGYRHSCPDLRDVFGMSPPHAALVLPTIGASALHENAFWNSGMLETAPLTRYFPDECGSVAARSRSNSGRRFSHQIWPNPMKKPLLGREAVHDGRRGLPRPRQVRHQRQPDAAVVGRVLAERQLAVEMRIAGDDVLRVLVGDARGALFVRLRVAFGPPVAQVALAVELAALIVEAVRQLVADDGARAAVVDRRVAPGLVEGRLQDAGREVDVVAIRRCSTR